MGLDPACLKHFLIFEQIDGSPMGGSACKLKMEKIPMGMGVHWERVFIVALKVQYPLVLGTEWLCKHMPHVDWSKGEIWLESRGCKIHVQGSKVGLKASYY